MQLAAMRFYLGKVEFSQFVPVGVVMADDIGKPHQHSALGEERSPFSQWSFSCSHSSWARREWMMVFDTPQSCRIAAWNNSSSRDPLQPNRLAHSAAI